MAFMFDLKRKFILGSKKFVCRPEKQDVSLIKVISYEIIQQFGRDQDFVHLEVMSL